MPAKEVIDVPNVSESVSQSYEQCVRADDWVSIAGQVGIDADGNVVSSAFETQAQTTFSNVKRCVEAAGGSLDDIVAVTVYLTDMADADAFVEIRRDRLPRPYPTSSLIGVDELALPELSVEVAARAYVPIQ